MSDVKISEIDEAPADERTIFLSGTTFSDPDFPVLVQCFRTQNIRRHEVRCKLDPVEIKTESGSDGLY